MKEDFVLKEWHGKEKLIGSDLVELVPAITDEHGIYYGRNTSDDGGICFDCVLCTSEFYCLQVEDYCKWYNLCYLFFNEEGNEYMAEITHGDIITGVDHYYHPSGVVKFCHVNHLALDAISYLAICEMYLEDSGDDVIPDEYLPSMKDLADVLVFNMDARCATFYKHPKYITIGDILRYTKDVFFVSHKEYMEVTSLLNAKLMEAGFFETFYPTRKGGNVE